MSTELTATSHIHRKRVLKKCECARSRAEEYSLKKKRMHGPRLPGDVSDTQSAATVWTLASLTQEVAVTDRARMDMHRVNCS
jgi:hypothetical protein